MENVSASDSKMTKLNRSNHGTFVMMNRYKIGAKQWEDLVENDDPVPRDEESAEDFSKRKSECMLDMLQSISPSVMSKVVRGANNPRQLWDNIVNFGKECKSLRLTTIRNSLYQLRLRSHMDYEWWSNRMYKWMEDLSALTGEDMDEAEKLSILLISLGENFSQLRQGLATSADISFEAAMETVRSECIAAILHRETMEMEGEQFAFNNSLVFSNILAFSSNLVLNN